jgi:peptidoglycan/xylan/chitin deacetylase (PgdA/CDA1 family)
MLTASLIALTVLLIVAVAVYYSTYAVRSQWLGATVWRARTDSASVALTFDDGPSADTERVLDLLSHYGVSATFFMVGRQIETFPDIALRVAEEGHEIGNHSYSHPIYLYRSARETRRQLERTQQIIADVTGVRARLARPPCGVRTPAYFRAAQASGLQTVQWTVAAFDWKERSPADIARSILSDLSPGSIILLHDGDSANLRDRIATVEALPLIIEGIKEKGLQIAPLAQLLNEDGATVVAEEGMKPMRKQTHA